MAKINNKKYASFVLKTLGIDPEKDSYDIDNLDVSQDVVDAAEASLDIASLEAKERALELAAKRAAEYPSIGDQLDAIWKQLKASRIRGEVLVTNDILDKVLAVKKKYQK